jgi:cell division protein FtsB
MTIMENNAVIRSSEPLRLRQALIPFVCIIVLGYFAYHAVYGRLGFISFLDIQNRIDLLAHQLEDVERQRQQLDRQVALLRPESLDPDLLDERARAALGYANPNELVIFLDPPPASARPAR